MSDTTLAGDTRRAQAVGRISGPQADQADELLAFLLIQTWTLVSGRVLRSDVPPAELEAEELIAFWADDLTATGS